MRVILDPHRFATLGQGHGGAVQRGHGHGGVARKRGHGHGEGKIDHVHGGVGHDQ